jgi:hypothetical protein
MSALRRDVESRTPSAKVFAHQLDTWLYGLGRPVGYAEVAEWMQDVFSDRLLVRDELLIAPQDSGPASVEELVEREFSASTLVSTSKIQSTSFAPPKASDPTGLTMVGTPDAKKKRDEATQRALRLEVDRTLDELRAKNRRRSSMLVWVGVLAVALAIALVALALHSL